MGDRHPSKGLYLHLTIQTQKRSRHTFIHRVGMEPKVIVLKRPKILCALDCEVNAAIVVGIIYILR
jgi:hypothetical protein